MGSIFAAAGGSDTDVNNRVMLPALSGETCLEACMI